MSPPYYTLQDGANDDASHHNNCHPAHRPLHPSPHQMEGAQTQAQAHTWDALKYISQQHTEQQATMDIMA